MKSSRKILFFTVIVVMLTLAMPASVFAAKKSKRPYKDVTLKTVDKSSYTAIKYVKKYKGWQGLVKNGRLYPNRYMTKHELYVVLHNLYGTKVPASVVTACKGKKVKMSTQFVRDQLITLGKSLGLQIKWGGNSYVMRRKDVARQIKIFAEYDSAFTPRPANSGSSSSGKLTEAEILAILRKLLGL